MIESARDRAHLVGRDFGEAGTWVSVSGSVAIRGVLDLSHAVVMGDVSATAPVFTVPIDSGVPAIGDTILALRGSDWRVANTQRDGSGGMTRLILERI